MGTITKNMVIASEQEQKYLLTLRSLLLMMHIKLGRYLIILITKKTIAIELEEKQMVELQWQIQY